MKALVKIYQYTKKLNIFFNQTMKNSLIGHVYGSKIVLQNCGTEFHNLFLMALFCF